MIDPDDLVGLFSSVDPAQFEFADGMITKVDYKVTSEVGPILKETAGLAAKIAATVAFPGELKCQQTLIDKLTVFETEQKPLKQAKAQQTAVEGRFFNLPSAAMKLAVERADANVATIQNNVDAHRPLLQITAVATPDTSDKIEFVPDLTAYEGWF